MRKNGINRKLRLIEGGVCAPEGYSAGAVSCGIREEGGFDLMMILSDRRCAVGYVGTSGKNAGAPVKVSKKNIRMGYSRAMIANGGVANALQENGERLAFKTCDLFFAYGLERTEILLASTGEIGRPFPLEKLEGGVKPLLEGLSATNEASLAASQAIRGRDCTGKQLSFAFDLGDYPCKIGVIFKGGRQTAPNMATFLAFLTTDVNISTPMLQRALEAEVRETLNMLSVDGTTSPNDCVCIFANGRAGNYKIDCVDSEYKKFTLALRAVLTEICKATAREGGSKMLTCRVCGGISKEAARTVAKAIVENQGVKAALRKGGVDVKDVLYTALATENTLKAERFRLWLKSSGGEMLLFEDGSSFAPISMQAQNILSYDEVELFLELGEGNYQAVAYGVL